MKNGFVSVILTFCLLSCEFDPANFDVTAGKDSEAFITDIIIPEEQYTIDLSGDIITIIADITGQDLSRLRTETVFEGKTLKVDGKIAPNGISVCDYSNSVVNPVVFMIIAENGTVRNYSVTVTALVPDNENPGTGSGQENQTVEPVAELPEGNKGLRPGTNIRITEAVFHGDSVDDEYIEIYNPSDQNINLNNGSSPQNEFRLYRITRSGNLHHIYTFPQDSFIDAGATLRIANSNSIKYAESDYHFDDNKGLIASDEGTLLLTVFTCNSGIIVDLVCYASQTDWDMWPGVIVDSSGPSLYSSKEEPVGESGRPVCLGVFWSSDPIAVDADVYGIRRVNKDLDADIESEWEVMQ